MGYCFAFLNLVNLVNLRLNVFFTFVNQKTWGKLHLVRDGGR